MQKASTDKARAREFKVRHRSERERRGMCSNMAANAKRRAKHVHDTYYSLFINKFVVVGKFWNWKWLDIVVKGLKKQRVVL